MMGVAKALESASEIAWSAGLRQERVILVVRSQLARGLAGTAAVAFIIWNGGSVTAAIAGQTLAWLATLLLLDSPTMKSALHQHSFQEAGRMPLAQLLGTIKTAFPLAATMALVSLIANVPRYAAEKHIGLHAVGVFSAISYLFVAGQAVSSAVGTAMSPRLARAFNTGDASMFRALERRIVAVHLAIGLLGVCASLLEPELLLELF